MPVFHNQARYARELAHVVRHENCAQGERLAGQEHVMRADGLGVGLSVSK